MGSSRLTGLGPENALMSTGKEPEDLRPRTKRFAHRCVKTAMRLPKDVLGNVIRGQLIRCSTSVAANYRAASLGQSPAAFSAKISIVLEEVDESWFWLEFIHDEELLNGHELEELVDKAEQLTGIFATIRKKTEHRDHPPKEEDRKRRMRRKGPPSE